MLTQIYGDIQEKWVFDPVNFFVGRQWVSIITTVMLHDAFKACSPTTDYWIKFQPIPEWHLLEEWQNFNEFLSLICMSLSIMWFINMAVASLL